MAAKESVMQVRMDTEMKERVERLYRQMGITFADAVRMFAAQSLLENGMPFQPSAMRRLEGPARPAMGSLRAYANPDLIPLEEGAMARVMEEKYGNPG